MRQHWDALPSVGLSKVETSLARPDGGRIWVMVDAHPGADERSSIEGVLTDVTALKTAYDQKTVLLKEVFHRVNNNLQLVDALLVLQGQRFSDETICEGFRAISGRIRSLSLIQQKLYQGDDFQTIDFSAYLKDLTDALMLVPRRPEITTSFELDPVFLPIEKATPLGLVANELLTNSLKHAFPFGRAGEIRVSLRRGEDGDTALTITDNGVGSKPIAFPSSIQAGLATGPSPSGAASSDGRNRPQQYRFATTVRFRS